MSSAKDVFDEARYVAFSDDEQIVAVWHGGHTINVYQVNHLADGGYEAVDAISIISSDDQ
jgi:hypothetical protein